MKSEIDIIIAKTAGMCYGVRRALKIAENTAKKYGKVFTIGELVHNTDETERLKNLGVIPIKTSCLQKYANCGSRFIIRAHGVGQSVYDMLCEMGAEYEDATCPDVLKIHRIIADYTKQGKTVLIIGDNNHPEVVGIVGHCNKNGSCYVLGSENEVTEWLRNHKSVGENALIVLAQTTFARKKWHNCKEIVRKHYTKAEIFDTICNATASRQEEAEALARRSDVMLVLGGSNSSNSAKLAEICRNITTTFFIENASQLNLGEIKKITGGKGKATIGITAGASTPAYIIKEVHCVMSEEVKKGQIAEKEMTEGDLDFLAEIDKTFKRVYIGNRVKAYVVSVNKTEAVVDIGVKHSGYIPADELTNDPSKQPSDVVKPGDEVDCIVTSINDAEGVVYLSKKKVDAALGTEKIVKAYENSETLEGFVSTVVKGGIIVVCEGARVFVPASQTGVPRTGKLEELLKKNVKFKVIEVNEGRGRIVGSVRAASKEVNDVLKQAFWAEISEGKKYTGEVKSIESYGVFVDLGGVDGMVHLSELTWNRIKHPKEVVSIGDKLNVYVKGFDPEKKRVSLGAKDPNDNPWEKFKNEFVVSDTVKVQIVSITPFGAFAQIIPGVDGLIHISQISNERVNNVAQVLSVGQVVEAKITEIEPEKSRVSLSMKALLEPENNETEESDELIYSDDNKEEAE